MRQILPHTLWLGHAADAQDFKRKFDLGINALAQLAVEEAALQPPRAVWLILFGILTAPFLKVSFAYSGDLLAVLAIEAGVVLLLKR